MPDTQMNLESPRVCLRELKLTDLVDVYVNIRDKEVGRWSVPPPGRYSENAVGRFVWRFAGHVVKTLRVVWQTLFPARAKSEFKLGIVLRETGRVIGAVTISRIDQQGKSGQMGFWIGKNYWGKGLATDAVNLALKFCFMGLRLDRVDAWTFDGNIGSIRVMEKCGLKLEDVIQKAYFQFNRCHDKLNYSILRSEWNARG